MAAGHNFILDLTIVLGASALGGYCANRLRQPVLLGYLLSGVVVGPFGLKLLNEVEQIEPLAEIGVALLLFALGVEFSLAELKRVKDIALKGSVLQIGLTVALVAILATLVGWVEGIVQGIFLGAILSLSSTAVVLKTLTERGEVNTLHGQVMLGILIAQDLALGLMLAILPALNQPADLGTALLAAFLKISLFLAAAIAVGRWIVPKVIKNIASTESSELFLLTVIALCLGVALITASLGISIEMGAFVAGLMIAEIDYADQALAKILPLRDTFASLFFASIGMLIDPSILLDNLGIIISLVTIVMLGKAIIILPIVLKFGYSFKTAVISAFGLNQIGEFSFVLALVGLEQGFISQEKYLLILGTTAITLVLTPIGLKLSPRLAEKIANLPILANYLRKFRDLKDLSIPEKINNHVVVAGYGRVGQVVVNILKSQGYQVLVIENSEAAIKRLKTEQIPYLFGDGDSELVLEKAHLEKAKALAIALPDPNSTRLLLKRALKLAPELDIVARSHENSEIDLLTQLGAREVVQPEFEAALEMGAHMLSTLGVTQNQIQSVISAIRRGRYLTIRPERADELLQKDLREVAPELKNEWLTLPANSPLDNRTLAAANIRNLTGATVMTIQQHQQTIYYPKGETILRSGDKLMVVGNAAELAAFRDLIQGKLDNNSEPV
ncbi:cation:proton antiporter domain-containing protein [Oscillatoria salina]|uniref:cation:proton antiporter domain-containing protein n=1 Tax=Oscillatoria salina TaxID=331517 RepID=UPI0013BBBB48|nr:cation:proton antiporter [Oscillatoria salina]MBZ8183004.1 sodium:calcium exchanger [Oscillatoria salina IIICB1]NET86635.1 sodium:calcium exchanger [Kamptonema sp. SIO1D9]